MEVHIINTSEIKKAAHRFDADYHLSNGVSIRRTIDHSPYKTISIDDVTSRIFYGLRTNRTYVTNRHTAIPFLTGADILLTDLRNTKLVSKRFTPCVEEMTLHKEWVLIYCCPIKTGKALFPICNLL